MSTEEKPEYLSRFDRDIVQLNTLFQISQASALRWKLSTFFGNIGALGQSIFHISLYPLIS